MSETLLPARLEPYVEALVASGIYGCSAEEVVVRAVERLVEIAIAAGTIDLQGEDKPREAQQVEHPIPNRTAEGSSPSGGAIDEEKDLDEQLVALVGPPASGEGEQCGSRATDPPPAAPTSIMPQTAWQIPAQTCHFCGFKTKSGIFVDEPGEDKVWRCAECEVGARPVKVIPSTSGRLCPHEDCRKPLRVDNTKGQCAKCSTRGRSPDSPVRGTAAAAR